MPAFGIKLRYLFFSLILIVLILIYLVHHPDARQNQQLVIFKEYFTGDRTKVTTDEVRMPGRGKEKVDVERIRRWRHVLDNIALIKILSSC